MWTDKRNLGIIAAFVVLAAVAIAGWARHATPTAEANPLPSVQTDSEAQPPLSAPVSGRYVSNRNDLPSAGYASASARSDPGETEYANSYAGSYQQDGYYSSIHRPLSVRVNTPPPPAPAEEYQPEAARRDEPRDTAYRNRREERVYRGETHPGRSAGKSVAIVAGSAGAGAAIGAIAGGGKGAAIGALSGGGAGFIYDRLTHNH